MMVVVVAVTNYFGSNFVVVSRGGCDFGYDGEVVMMLVRLMRW